MDFLTALLLGFVFLAFGLSGRKRRMKADVFPIDMAMTRGLLATGIPEASSDLEREIRETELLHLKAELTRQRALLPADALDDGDKVALAPAEAAPHTTDRRYTIAFKADEPTRFDAFTGQQHIIRPLRAAVQALETPRRVPAHALFTGLPGRGKTLLAKVVGHELQLRARERGLPPLAYLETFGSNLDSIDELDACARSLLEAGGGIWFIDEMHVLRHDLSTKIFALMEDQKYPFHGSVSTTPMPEVMVIGATTDYGKLHPALKRRFGEPYMVRPMTQAELLALIEHRQFPITADAAQALVDRTHWSGAPYEAITLRAQAEVFARADNRKQITRADVDTVFDTFEIDQLGLRWMERQVIRTLFKFPRYRQGTEFVCYGAAERDLCGAAGLDPEEYRETIKPRLMARRLLEIRPVYGQALTAHGAELYEHLKAA